MRSKIHPFDQQQRMQGEFEVHHYEDVAIRSIALHHHDFYEVYLFLSGNVIYNVESRSYRLHSGDILLISPLELHQAVITTEKKPYSRMVLWIEKRFLEQLSTAESQLNACFDVTNSNHVNLLRPNSLRRERITALMDEMVHEMDGKSYAGDMMAKAMLIQLLVELNREARQAKRRHEITDQSRELIAKVLQYINEQYAGDISLDSLSARFFISKYHLSREFHRLVGTSIHRYTVQKRLIMAKQMLLAGQMPTVVFANCGFGDYSNFYRAFKSEYGISPGEFAGR